MTLNSLANQSMMTNGAARNCLRTLILLPLILGSCGIVDGRAEEAETIVPAYTRFRADHLQADEAGRLLISELNCQSCHGEFGPSIGNPRQAPVLTRTADRLSPEYLALWLKDPQHLKPGTAMPGFAKLSENAQDIQAITAFLTGGSTWRAQAIGQDAVRRGEDLYHRIGCAACHGDQRTDEVISAIRRGLAVPDPDAEEEESAAPPAAEVIRPDFLMPLGALDQKYSLGGLISFLREPHLVRPSGRMPSLNLSPEEARDVASYLLKDVKVASNIEFEFYEGTWNSLPDFSTLKPVSRGTTTDFSVGAAPKADNFALRFLGYLQIPKRGEYRIHIGSDDGSRVLIDDQEVVNNDGIHPQVDRSGTIALSEGSHTLVVEYFEQGGGEVLVVDIEGPGLSRQPLAGLVTLTRDPPQAAPEPASQMVTPELVAKGRELFASYGCAACHQHGEGDSQIASSLKAPQFAALKSEGGCLSSKPATHVPTYRLSERQREDLRQVITQSQSGSSTAPLARAQEIRQTMLSLNCFACHTRDGLGGVSEPLNHVFVGTIPEMGDEGRVPPALDGAGDKLQENWLTTIFSGGAKDRPYMATRMPAFGARLAEYLVPRLAAVDRREPVADIAFSEPEHRVKADARLLVGDQALSCIKCHRFDNYAATGLQSLDMTTMTTRLRRDWFHRYLLDPQKYRPGTRMPSAWPGGKSIIPHVMDGDSERQIEAIWRYLQDGKRARVPSGLERQAIVLVPQDRPLIYRNFIEGLSPRGIAVGFPEKVHYAWDAEQMTPRLIWHGAFIDAAKHWVDRGPGNQTPMGDHVMTLPPGPPVAVLESLDTAWPVDNPKNSGFQFRGYQLNRQGVPSLRYQWNEAEWSDTLEPFTAQPDNGLKRTLTVRSPRGLDNVWVRVAVGEITGSGQQWLWNGIQLTIDGGLPTVRRIGDQQELLIQLPPGARETSLKITLVW